jgi:F0F1-type ATP synthase membrane subunit b/b'
MALATTLWKTTVGFKDLLAFCGLWMASPVGRFMVTKSEVLKFQVAKAETLKFKATHAEVLKFRVARD